MKLIYRSIYLLFLLCIGILSGTCTDEASLPDVGEDNRAAIALSMSNVQMRGGDLFIGDDIIKKIRIYVMSNGYVDHMKVYTAGSNDFKNPFRITTTTGRKTIYVIANEPDRMSGKLNKVTTFKELKSLDTPKVSETLRPPLTMVGSGNVTVTTGTNTVTVKLVRLAARLDLKILKGEKAKEKNIQLEGIRLYRAPQSSSLLGQHTVAGQTYWDYNFKKQSPVTVTSTGVDVWGGTAEPIYLYENIGTKLDTLNRATYIVIDALYNGVDTRYHAYINDEHSSVEDKYSIKRNHKYELTATINNLGEYDGITLDTHILPWTVEHSDIVFERKYAIIPHPNVGNAEYELESPSAIRDFSFTLSSPVGAKWKALLTNPKDFELLKTSGSITSNSSVTSGGLGKFTISVRPTSERGRKERKTEFYIVVDGVEIPLLKNSTSVGPGHRIVMKQPAIEP